MKAKTIRHASGARLLAVSLLAVCALAAAANAGSFSGSFTLPFEVHWGRAVLPPGNYKITLNASTNVAQVRSVDGKIASFTSVPITNSSEKGATALSILVRGNQRVVRSLNLPRQGMSLIYVPETNAEREILAKADGVLTVPVAIAGK